MEVRGHVVSHLLVGIDPTQVSRLLYGVLFYLQGIITVT